MPGAAGAGQEGWATAVRSQAASTDAALDMEEVGAAADGASRAAAAVDAEAEADEVAAEGYGDDAYEPGGSTCSVGISETSVARPSNTREHMPQRTSPSRTLS